MFYFLYTLQLYAILHWHFTYNYNKIYSIQVRCPIETQCWEFQKVCILLYAAVHRYVYIFYIVIFIWVDGLGC